MTEIQLGRAGEGKRARRVGVVDSYQCYCGIGAVMGQWVILSNWVRSKVIFIAFFIILAGLSSSLPSSSQW